jgi:hypothetical protein
LLPLRLLLLLFRFLLALLLPSPLECLSLHSFLLLVVVFVCFELSRLLFCRRCGCGLW